MNKKKKSIFSTGKRVSFDLDDPLPPWDRKIINTLKKRMADIVAYTDINKVEETLIHQMEILVNMGDILSYSIEINIDGTSGDGRVAIKMDKDTFTVLDFFIMRVEED